MTNATVHAVLQWVTVFFTGCFVILCLILSFWALQPAKVLSVQDDPLPVHPQEVMAGNGVIIATINFCKTQAVTGTVKAFMVGEQRGAEPQLSWPNDNLGKVCLKEDFPIIIPAATQADTYHVVFVTTYQINPLKSQVVTFRTRSFQVLNPSLAPIIVK